MYANSRSPSTRNKLSPTAPLAIKPTSKRKGTACNSAKGPRKFPRPTPGSEPQRTKTELETVTTSGDSSSDDLEDEERANSVEIYVDKPEKDSERRHSGEAGEDGTSASGSEDVNKEDKFCSTTTIATRGQVENMDLKLSLARQVQVAATSTILPKSKLLKHFIPLDFQAIQQGFFEGGLNHHLMAIQQAVRL